VCGGVKRPGTAAYAALNSNSIVPDNVNFSGNSIESLNSF